MARRLPEETDVLCEKCGYALTGLPVDANCPECGTPIADSISDDLRKLPEWENSAIPKSRLVKFIQTTALIIFRPRHFYRSSTALGDAESAYHFAQIHWALDSLIIGLAIYIHTHVVRGMKFNFSTEFIYRIDALALDILVAYLAVAGTSALAARLTAWEASYRGYRLPLGVVRRALYYHAAHILPVGVVALAIVSEYSHLQRIGYFPNPWSAQADYLYVLCGGVIVGAAYLFQTYWIGMRNLMYANR